MVDLNNLRRAMDYYIGHYEGSRGRVFARAEWNPHFETLFAAAESLFSNTEAKVELHKESRPTISQVMTILVEGFAPHLLRDLFAAAALQGLLAGERGIDLYENYERAARHAYHHADAMLKARKDSAGNS